MANEKVKVELPVVPTIDKKAVRNVTRQIQNLEKELGPIKVSFSEFSKIASSSINVLNNVASAAEAMGKKVEKAAKTISSSSGKSRGRKTGPARKTKETPAPAHDDGTESATRFNDALDDLSKHTKKQTDIAKKAAKAQYDYAKSLKVRRVERIEGFKEIAQAIPGLVTKGGFGGAVKGGARGFSKAAGVGPGGVPTTAAKNLHQHHQAMQSGSSGGSGGGGMGMLSGLMKAGPVLAAAAGSIAAIFQIIKLASASQTKVNKALVEGVGFANDFGMSSVQYKSTVDDLRNAVQDASYSMLKFGGNSEKTAKILNSFAKESTGSLGQVKRELTSLGDGDLKDGVTELATSAMAYGKALNMEGEEVASMMGKFTTELGVSAKGSIDTMENIVRAAAGANMPMTKFMGIFNSVIPDVELYQNRLEELTGTIRLLSKTMSAKDVKNFTDSFTKGFSGTDFRSRLKTVLIAGQDTVSNALDKDFQAKAKTMAAEFRKSDLQVDDGDFVKAMQGGEQTMSALINDLQAQASRQGKQLGGAQVSNAMKLAGYEASRRKGGALNLSTAMSGAGQMATYKILLKQSQAFTTGFDGLSEHVIKQLGISEQQYEALRTMHQTMIVQKDQLKKYGMTNSKAMNTQLREVVKTRKKNMSEKDIEEAMRNATDDELIAASEAANNIKDGNKKVIDLASEQYNVTTDIGDKLDNVIAYLLEQVLRLLQPLLDYIEKLFDWIVGNSSQKHMTSILEDIKKSQGIQSGTAAEGMLNDAGETISAALGKNLSPDELAKSFAKSGILPSGDVLKTNQIDAEKFGVDQMGLKSADLGNFLNSFQAAQNKGDTDGMLKALANASGNSETLGDNLLKLTAEMAKHDLVTDKSMRYEAGRNQFTRPNAKRAAHIDEIKKANDEAGVASDIQALGVPGRGPSPAATASSPTANSPTDHIENMSESMDKQVDLAEKAHDTQQATQKATEKTAESLREGVKYESSFLSGPYQNTLKQATLDSFRQALVEFAVLQQRIQSDSGLQSALAGPQGWNFAQGGFGAVNTVLSSSPGEGVQALNQNGIGGFAAGGSVDYDQLAKVHQGEFVIPRGGALIKSSGSGGPSIGQINVNVRTDANPKQIAQEIHNAFSQQ